MPYYIGAPKRDPGFRELPIYRGPPRLAPVARGTPAQPLRAEVCVGGLGFVNLVQCMAICFSSIEKADQDNIKLLYINDAGFRKSRTLI